MKNIRIVLNKKVGLWISRRAAEENTSVTEFVGRILENQMRADYWHAYRKWKGLSPAKGIEAAHRMSREQSHARW